MPPAVKKAEVGGYKDRFWYPRFWDGMTVRAAMQLLKSGNYRVSPLCWGMVGVVLGLGLTVNSPSAVLQRLFYGRKIRETELAAPPLFVIGHWRSGTTLLHEYLINDKRFGFADTYTCFAPEHFIFSRFYLRPFAAVLMPKKRPIDNMAAGFDHPQEDEFALMSKGMPSPYRNIFFPNNAERIDFDYLTLKNITAEKRTEWLDGLDEFLRALTYLSPKKRIVLKSPTHTGRIAAILEKYPNAQFIHIHRNPYSIFPSAYNLWMRLSKDEGAQLPKGIGMEDYIFDSLNTMYDAFDEDIKLLQPEQYCGVSYKELTSVPLDTLEKIYSTLQLGNFDEVKPVLEKFAASQKEYKKNKFEMDATVKRQIAVRWSRYFERFGYNI